LCAELFALITQIKRKGPRMARLIQEELTRSVIGAFYDSYNKLGTDSWRKCV